MALITTSVAKRYLPLLQGTDKNDLLDDLVEAADGLMAAWCGYPPATPGAGATFLSATYTRYFGSLDLSRGNRLLRLDVLPVASITSIYDDINYDWDDEDLVAESDYTLLDGSRGWVQLVNGAAHSTFNDGESNIKVTFVAGFTTAPAALQDITARLVAYWYNTTATIGRQSVSQSGQSVSAEPPSIPDFIKDNLSDGGFRLPGTIL